MPCVFLERCVDARAVHLSCSVPSSVDRMDEPAPTYQPLYTSAVVVLLYNSGNLLSLIYLLCFTYLLTLFYVVMVRLACPRVFAPAAHNSFWS